jgi:hypothetical protein
VDTRVDSDPRSVADLIRDLRDESTALLRQEVALAKTEMTEKATKLGRNVGYLLAGASVAVIAVLFLLSAVSEGLRLLINDTEWAPHGDWIAPLIVGLFVTGLAMSLISKAKHALANTSLVPEKTIETLKEDKQWAQAKTH